MSPVAPADDPGAWGATVAQSTAPSASKAALPAVPGYTVSREVARGGMGVVYAADDLVFEREVAVKVMHPGQDAARFVVEAKVTAQLPHPGVPQVYALGTLADGRPFLAMKLIGGHTLANELKTAARAQVLPQLLDVFRLFSPIPILLGFGLAMVLQTIGMVTAVLMTRREGWISIPLPCTYLWFAHDLGVVVRFDTWFNEIYHWFLKLFWVGLLSALIFGVGMPTFAGFRSITLGTVIFAALFSLSGLAYAAITRS